MIGTRREEMTDTKQGTKATTEPTKTERKQRSAFNGTRGKLQVGHLIPGYHLHIFNDSPGRIQAAIDSGYEFVSPDEVGGTMENVTSRNTDLGDKVRFLVGTDGNDPVYAYVLKIKEEWWKDDQADLQKRNDATDAAIRSGKLTKDGMSSDGFYNAGIKY